MTCWSLPHLGGSREKRATAPQVRPSSAAPGSEQMSVKPRLPNVLCPGGDESRPAGGPVVSFTRPWAWSTHGEAQPSLRLQKTLSYAGGRC